MRDAVLLTRLALACSCSLLSTATQPTASSRRRADLRRAGASTGTNSEHSYPSSSKKHTNWDALAKAATAEEEKSQTAAGNDPNAGGDKQLNELFQKLYADATDEQRRAMVKSYQESNGTALSTDWNEVKKVCFLLLAREVSRRS